MRPIFKPLIWNVYELLPNAILQPLVRHRHGHIWTLIPEPDLPVLVHIPKTGGSSVAQELYGQTINHYPVSIWQMGDPERFLNARVFAILRDPTERLISAIRHCISGPRASQRDLQLGRYLKSFAPNTLGMLEAYLDSGSLRRVCASNIMFKSYDFWLGTPGEFEGLQVFKLQVGGANQSSSSRQNVNLAENNITDLPEHLAEKARHILKADYDWFDQKGVDSVKDATDSIAMLATLSC